MQTLAQMRNDVLKKLNKKRKLGVSSFGSPDLRLVKQVDKKIKTESKKVKLNKKDSHKVFLIDFCRKRKHEGCQGEQSLCSTSKRKRGSEGSQTESLKKRKHKKKKTKKKKDKVVPEETGRLQRRVKYLLVRMKLEQNLIDAYLGEGWKGQSREKIKPEKELQRAKNQILKCKLGIRETVHQLDSLSSDGQIDCTLIDPDGSVHHEHIICKKCKTQEVSEDNDIILCDGTCNCAFHQKCIDPPLATKDVPPEDEGWLCKYCNCKMEILEAMNAHLGTQFSANSTWQEDDTDSNCIDKPTLPEAEDEKTVDPCISEAEFDSFYTDDKIKPTLSDLERRLAKLKAQDPFARAVVKAASSKDSNVAKNPRLTRAKTFGTLKRSEPSRIQESPPTRNSVKRSVSANRIRRASMLSANRAAIHKSAKRPIVDILKRIKSPDISVNSPRIDRIAEFPSASYEEPFFLNQRNSLVSRQDSSSPLYDGCSITKDKFSVQFSDTGFSKKNLNKMWQSMRDYRVQEGKDDNNNSLDQNATAGASSHDSSDLRRRRFDTSSYQQRAEALEGLLEFSAKLLQQERFDELCVLLKPFGPEKVSPRETAIWLSKSFKEPSPKLES